MKRFFFVILFLIACASVAGNVLLYKRYSSQRPLLRTAQGVQVTRKEFQDLIDFKYGKQVLNKLTYEKIIRHAAEKAGVMPAEKDVDARLELIGRRSPQTLERLKSDPTKMAEMRGDTLTELALENLRIRDVKVTEAEAKAYLAKHRNDFAVPLQVKTTLVVALNDVDAAAAKKMLQQNIPLDVIARRPRLRVAGFGGWDPDWSLFPPVAAEKLGSAARRLKAGEVASVPLSKFHFILRMDRRSEGGVPGFSNVRDQVVRAARLRKASSTRDTLARLYRESDIKFEVGKYAAYFDDVRAYAETLEKKSGPDAGKAALTPVAVSGREARPGLPRPGALLSVAGSR